MTWYEMNQRRRINRGVVGSLQRRKFREGHARRSKAWAAYIDRKTGELVAQAHNGCFGRLAVVDRDAYDEWASGTSGEH